MRSLREKHGKWIKEQNKSWKKNRNRHLSRREISHWARIREHALEEIRDLIFLANNLPENQLKLIFPKPGKDQPENLVRWLFKAIFKPRKLKWEIEKELQKKRNRLLLLSRSILFSLCDPNFTRELAPKTTAYFTEIGERELINGLRVILHGRE